MGLAKWLPHTRDRGQLTILATEPAQRRSADALWRTGGAGLPITVLVVDEPDHWNRRTAALREVVSAPPTALRLVVQCARLDSVPASCRSLVVQDGDHVSVTSATNVSGVREVTDVVPSLVEPAVAAEVARALAPLVDIADDATSSDDRLAAPEALLLVDALREMVDRASTRAATFGGVRRRPPSRSTGRRPPRCRSRQPNPGMRTG